jgi:myo-inositol catabolism protein IolC
MALRITTPGETMDLGYDGRLFILAFDHRGSFKTKMFGLAEDDDSQAERLREAKRLVWDGFRVAHEAGLPDGAGILVDEEMGADVAAEARDLGIPFAMPVERSGQNVFDFEYDDDFDEHIRSFDPTFAKVLVRWNPDDDPEIKLVQGERLRRLGDWLRAEGRRFLFELLVPASDRQLTMVGGDKTVYDTRMRPMLMLDTIDEIRSAGVEPDVWKIEGIHSPEDAHLIGDFTRADDRSRVASVVLGRGADDSLVDHWLRTGAPVPGYAGFAIGRSIWWDAVAGWKEGKITPTDAANAIAAKYRRFIDVYLGASA